MKLSNERERESERESERERIHFNFCFLVTYIENKPPFRSSFSFYTHQIHRPPFVFFLSKESGKPLFEADGDWRGDCGCDGELGGEEQLFVEI